jgi:hypothetical protein
MTTPTLKLELTVAEIDMAFVLFQAAKQDKHTYEEINTLMRKIQEQGRPQLEALALKKETPPPAPKVRKPREPKAPKMMQVAAGHTVVDIPDLSDLKLD